MIEKNISEEAKNAMTMKPVLDEMPDRIKIDTGNKEMQDFINWHVGINYDDCKDMSRDDLILFILRHQAVNQFIRMGNEERTTNQIDDITNVLIDSGIAEEIEEDDNLSLKLVKK